MIRKIFKIVFPKEILILFLFSRFFMFGVGELASNIFPKYDRPAEYEIVDHGTWQSRTIKLPHKLHELLPLKIDSWIKFDSDWYIGIALLGYDKYDAHKKHPPANWLFFPLYPLILSCLAGFLDVRVAGIVISNLLFYCALVLFHRLILMRTQDQTLGFRSVFYLLIFPTSIYFSLIYTESLFLLLTIAGFYFMENRNYGWASVAASLAAVTRIPGFLLAGIIVIKYFGEQGWSGFNKPRKEFLYFLMIPLPFIAFLLYMQALTGDFLAPFHEHKNWGGRAFAFPFLNWYHYLTDPYFVYPGGWDLGVLSFLIFTGSLLSLLWGYNKISGWMYLYALMNFFIISVSYPSLQSFNRYISAIFPLYIIWASFSRNRLFEQIFTSASLAFWTFYVIAFINNYYFVV